MKALLLAAGRGTRISRHLNGNPKCTVDLGNEMPLICYTVSQLRAHGVDQIAVVTGYRNAVVEKTLEGTDVRFFYNPFFDVTNSIASAWFARDFIRDDDILIMNADVFCEHALYDDILAVKDSPVVFYDTTRIEDADYKFYCENGEVRKYGKELTPEETSGEYVGIAKLAMDFTPRFMEQLEEMIRTQQHSVWWENVLYSMSERIPLRACDVAGKFWAEVDYIEDYKRIMSYVAQHNGQG